MGLLISTIGSDSGLMWEQNLNASLTTLDGHNHSPGSGVPITPQGMNINSNLSFQNFSATNIYGLFFGGSTANSSNGVLYTAPSSGGGINDLFYNDFAGNVIQITKAGILNATASSIPGESYSGGTFTWVQGAASTTPANFDIGSITIRPNTAGTTNGITLSPPSGIASAYSLVLPALPGANSFVALDNSGNVTATIPTSLGIDTGNIAAGAVTRPKQAAVGQQVSSSCGIFNHTGNVAVVAITNLSVTITTTGRPVMIMLIADGSASGNSEVVYIPGGSAQEAQIRFNRGATLVAQYGIEATGSFLTIPASSYLFFDTPPAGTYSYTASIKLDATGDEIEVNYTKLAVYEL